MLSHVYTEADGSRGFRLVREFSNTDLAAQLIRRRDGTESPLSNALPSFAHLPPLCSRR